MKKIIIIPLLFLSFLLSATNYYVKTGGDDEAAGTSDETAWASINVVNTVWAAGTFAPGDSILFNRGDTFSGTITVTESGSVGSPIVVGAYGTGADPIITGFSTLSSWTDEGGSIYSKTVSLASSDYIIVSVDGVNTAVGRYPNSAFLTIDSHSGTTSLTDATIPKATQDWTGADVVVRINEYQMKRRTITGHTNNTITYSTLGEEPTNGWGYFIQNYLPTLDATNEWYYDGTKFYIYGNPVAKTVKVSSLVNAVVINSFDYITFDNINFTGFGGDGFSLTDASNITIQNCSISFCGETAIRGNNETSGNSNNCTFNNNQISECNNGGINIPDQFDYATISNNDLNRIGIIVGAAYTASYYNPGYCGVSILGDPYNNQYNINSVIEYNRIDSIGYNGIYNHGVNDNNITIQYNEVSNFCMILQDGGGIYTYSDSYSDATHVGLIYKNIVYNGIGNHEGTTHSYHYAYGIYVDGYSRGITVNGNTSFSNNTINFFCNGNREGSFINNTSYNSADRYNFYLNNFSAAYIDVHENLVIKNNVFFGRDANEHSFFYGGGAGALSATMTIDSNYYARPIDDDYVFYSTYPSGSYYTLETWRTYSSQDANSNKSPIALTDTADIDFYYNASQTPDTIVLDTACIDVAGTKYADTLILAAYTSAVLMVDPDPDVDPPDIPTLNTSTTALGRVREIIMGGDSITAGGGTITDKGICYSQKPIPVVTDSTYSGGTGTDDFTVRITGLTPETTYYARAYATNASGTGYGGIVTLTLPASSPFKTGGKFIKHNGYYLKLQ